MQGQNLLVALVLVAGCHAKQEPHAATPAPAPPRVARLGALPADVRATESAAIAAATLDGRPIVLVADADDRAIVTLDGTTLAPLARTELEASPRDLLVLESGQVLATLPQANAVAVLESAGATGELRATRKVRTSTEPMAMAATLDGAAIAVTCGAAHRVDVLDGRTLVARASHDVPREPRAAMFSKHGLLFVSHAAQGRLSTLSVVPGAPAAKEDGVELGIPNATSGAAGFDPPRVARHADALVRLASADGERIVVPLVQNAPKGGAPPGGGYGGGSSFGIGFASKKMMVTSLDFDGEPHGPMNNRQNALPAPEPGPPNRMTAFDVRAVDAATASVVAAPERAPFALPKLLRECLLPRAAVATSDKRVLVACAGESTVLALDATAGLPTVVGKLAAARAPAAIARIDAGRAVVWSPLARTASSFDTSIDGDRSALVAHELPRVLPADALALRGRELFHRTGDPRIAADGLACASCHPDGRDDGLVWASPKGERRTRTLAGNAGRPSTFGWGGEHATIDVHVKETIKRLRGKGLPQDELDAIYAYVRSMHPVPAADVPHDPEALRGAALFASERAACATCHDPASGYTDHAKHEIAFQQVVTPSLLGVGARGTLFHDGKYRALDALLDGNDEMGGTARLTAEEKRDLSAFLRTL